MATHQNLYCQLQEGSPDAETTLDNIITNYTTKLKNCYKQYFRENPPLTFKTILRARRLIVKLKGQIHDRLQHPLQKSYMSKIISTIAKINQLQHHKHFVTTIQYQHNTNILKQWLHMVPNFLKQLKRQLKPLIPIRLSSKKSFRRKLLSTAKGRGTYYDYAFHGKSIRNTVINKTMNDNNEIVTDPKKYIPLIQKQVSAPFSNPQRGPAVYAGRSLSNSELNEGKPFWWDLFYSRNSSNLHPNTWSTLLQPLSPNELTQLLKRCKRNTAPGPDAIPTGVIKIVTNTYFNTPSTTPTKPTDNALFLEAYINAILRTSIMPPSQKKGIISLHPKPGKNPNHALNRRPITLLNELGKLPFKILAQRLTKILHLNPNILNPQQRAYLKNGSTKQCIEALVDITKEILQAPNSNLIITTYDVRKAFDSIQHYSIEATLNRFNFPHPFINLVLSALKDATSKVHTHHGLTDDINLRTSVRQGDPLAALIFILVLDVMHVGLRNNPLHPPLQQSPHGYTISSNNSSQTINATGYADDTNLINTNWNHHLQQHEWIVDFFTAHRLSFNPDKTYTTSKLLIPGNPRLPELHQQLIHDPIAGKPAIHEPYPEISQPLQEPCVSTMKIHPSDFTFRSLGLLYNINLNNTEMTRKLQKSLYMTTKNLSASRLTIPQSSFVIREFLIPRLELGLPFLPPPTTTFV